MRRRAEFEPLHEHDFRWFFASQTINLLGSAMASMALTFAVLKVDDSPTALGQVLAARIIPTILFLLLGGAIADRFPRVAVLQIGNLAAAVTQGAAAYLVISGHARVWELAALSAVNGTTSAITMPAMEGMVPQLVPKALLKPANLLMQQVTSGVQVFGPALSGILVAAFGSGPGLAVDAASWAIAALMMLPVRTRLTRARHESGILHGLIEGWGYFRKTQWLWVIVAAFSLLNAISTGALNTLGPAIANQTIGSHGWGIVRSAQALGMFAVTFVLMRVSLRRPLRTAMLVFGLGALPMLVMGFWVHTAPLAVAFFVAGAVSGVFSLAWSLVMQEQVPEAMLSRAISYDMLGSFVAMPVGQLAYGPLGDRWGFRPVMTISAVAFVLISLATLLSASVRTLRHVPPAD